MILRRKFLGTAGIGGMIIFSGCGKGRGSSTTGPSGPAESGSRIEFRNGKGSIDISKDGRKIGSLYVIGSCTGADDGNNSTSLRERMKDGARGCRGSEYVLSMTRIAPDKIRIYFEIELADNYRFLSLPFDAPDKSVFGNFTFAGSGYEVGCGNSWSGRPGSGGSYADIPASCIISGAGNVGAARTRGRVSWGEASGPYATLRRTPLSGNYARIFWFNHPHTNNIEIGFPENLRAGAVIGYQEEIWVK